MKAHARPTADYPHPPPYAARRHVRPPHGAGLGAEIMTRPLSYWCGVSGDTVWNSGVPRGGSRGCYGRRERPDHQGVRARSHDQQGASRLANSPGLRPGTTGGDCLNFLQPRSGGAWSKLSWQRGQPIPPPATPGRLGDVAATGLQPPPTCVLFVQIPSKAARLIKNPPL